MNTYIRAELPPRERIGLKHSYLEAVMLISDGNPGAIVAIAAMSRIASAADPDSIWGPWAPVMGFDSHGIYGAAIHFFFKDRCQSQPLYALTLLRAIQMGLIPNDRLHEWSQDECAQPQDLPSFADALAMVRQHLPAFAGGNLIPN